MTIIDIIGDWGKFSQIFFLICVLICLSSIVRSIFFFLSVIFRGWPDRVDLNISEDYGVDRKS